jgi:hypothetical protein
MSIWGKNRPKSEDPNFIKYKINDLKLFAKDEWYHVGPATS